MDFFKKVITREMFARFCTLNKAALVTRCEMSPGNKFIAHTHTQD